MPKYELTYATARYTDHSHVFMTSSEPETTSFEADDDEQAEAIAKGMMNRTNLQEIAFLVPIKLTRPIEVNWSKKKK